MFQWYNSLLYDKRRGCVVHVDVLAMTEVELRALGPARLLEEIGKREERIRELLAGVAEPDPRHWEG